MFRFITSRFLQYLVVLFVVVTAAWFILMKLIPWPPSTSWPYPHISRTEAPTTSGLAS